MTSNQRLGGRAVVIGGSIAGLGAARVLADYFDEVVVLERDHFEACPAPRKSVPQASHYHALLAGGERVLSTLFAGFTERLRALGAIRFRVGIDTEVHFPDGQAYTLFGRLQQPCDVGVALYSQSRELVEYVIRERVVALPNVRIATGITVKGLCHAHGSIRGVRYTGGGGESTLDGDLVVDAAGRGSQAPRWIVEFGYRAPAESVIGVDLAYASTRYRLPETFDESARSVFVVVPRIPTGGVLQEIENGVWQVTLGGRFGAFPPTDEAGFLGFARSLHAPRIYEIIAGAERTADITSYRFPASVWRHFERLAAFPDGFLVLGDAFCSFNPLYGQGMSAAMLQVEALQQTLRERVERGGHCVGIAKEFFGKAAVVIETPWSLAANVDLSFAETKGVRPRGMALRKRYSDALETLALEDIEVTRLLHTVYHLREPIGALSAPPLRRRALTTMLKNAFSRS
jgi:2-polyprenyl-6-methoxyphenol hydroxylase-like FAD-dependent oxidoreductase